MEDKEKKKIMSVNLTGKLVTRIKNHVKATCGNLSWWVEKVLTEALEAEEKDNDKK